MRWKSACVALLTGCGVSGPSSDNLYQAPAEEGPSTAAGPTGQSAAATTGVSSTSATSAVTSGGAGGSTTTTASAGGASEGCAPEPDDEPCIECLKQQCCNEIEACLQDQDCACWASCIEQGDYIACQTCGVPNAFLESLLTCAEGCQLECGF